jgi:hypothetical protein
VLNHLERLVLNSPMGTISLAMEMGFMDGSLFRLIFGSKYKPRSGKNKRKDFSKH